MSAPDAELLGLIYEAAIEPTRWLDLRKRLSAELDGGFWIFFDGVDTVADGQPMFLGTDDHLRRHMIYRADDDDPYNTFVRASQPGDVWIPERALTAEQLEASAYGAQVATLLDYGGAVHAMLHNTGGRLILVGVTVNGRRVGDADVERMRALIPHLMRAARMTDHLREVEHQHHSMRQAIDLLHVSVLLVTSELQIRWCNTPAERLLERGDPLGRSGNRLRANDPEQAARLAQLVEMAAPGKPEVARLETAGGDAWCSVLATRVDTSDGAASPAVALFVSHSSQLDIDAGILCALHGLTPAEAEVTRLLATGQSTEEIAARRRVRQGTVRAQLKQIFAKTGCRTQADLVRLVLVGPAVLRRSAS